MPLLDSGPANAHNKIWFYILCSFWHAGWLRFTGHCIRFWVAAISIEPAHGELRGGTRCVFSVFEFQFTMLSLTILLYFLPQWVTFPDAADWSNQLELWILKYRDGFMAGSGSPVPSSELNWPKTVFDCRHQCWWLPLLTTNGMMCNGLARFGICKLCQ